MRPFISGALMMGQVVAAGFFFRFYRVTRDRLFLGFAVAFSILAVSRVALAVAEAPDEVRPLFYVLRLLAFIVILVAIVDKNRDQGSPRGAQRNPEEPRLRGPG